MEKYNDRFKLGSVYGTGEDSVQLNGILYG